MSCIFGDTHCRCIARVCRRDVLGSHEARLPALVFAPLAATPEHRRFFVTELHLCKASYRRLNRILLKRNNRYIQKDMFHFNRGYLAVAENSTIQTPLPSRGTFKQHAHHCLNVYACVLRLLIQVILLVFSAFIIFLK